MIHPITRTLAGLAALATSLLPGAYAAAPEAALDIQVYNPQDNARFPVTSTLVSGPTEAVLFDAQFERKDALNLVRMVQASGRTLKAIYVSHSDPDYYFGLDVLTEAFPEAKVLTTAASLAKIKAKMQAKLDFWGPKLGDNAPRALITPEVLDGDTLTVDSEKIVIVGLDGHDPAHTFGWIPSRKTVLGGVVLFDNMHLWVADNQSAESRRDWLQTLDAMAALQPERVIAGHLLGHTPADASIIRFTQDYLHAFERAHAETDSAAALTEKMVSAYPELPERGTLEFSASIVKGDIPWPQ